MKPYSSARYVYKGRDDYNLSAKIMDEIHAMKEGVVTHVIVSRDESNAVIIFTVS